MVSFSAAICAKCYVYRPRLAMRWIKPLGFSATGCLSTDTVRSQQDQRDALSYRRGAPLDSKEPNLAQVNFGIMVSAIGDDGDRGHTFRSHSCAQNSA